VALLVCSTSAVTLKADSYSAESALAQLDVTQMPVDPCLCFRYKTGADDSGGAPATDYSEIEEGGFLVDLDSNS
jgi:hypothetical protein